MRRSIKAYIHKGEKYYVAECLEVAVVRISEQLFKELQKYAEPLTDNVESTIWKMLRLLNGKPATARTTKRVSRVKGKLTGPSEFWKPILEALIGKGGRASRIEVHKAVEKKLTGRLTASDYELNVDRNTKWSKQADYQRLAMVLEGLLENNSPRGIWEITDLGKAWLSQH